MDFGVVNDPAVDFKLEAKVRHITQTTHGNLITDTYTQVIIMTSITYTMNSHGGRSSTIP